MRTATLSVLAGLALASGSALAANVLQIDVNALEGQATDTLGNATAFGGLAHVGSIMLSGGVNSTLAEVLIDGADQNVAPNQFASFSGTIDVSASVVTGGSLSLSLVNGDTFTAIIVAGSGHVNTQAGQGFSIDGLLTSAFFNASTFAGVDITPWYLAQMPSGLNGSFLNFQFSPNASGFDSDTDIDIFVVIPTPLAAGMAGVGLMGLAARRRRA
jgi:hypothetical protein